MSQVFEICDVEYDSKSVRPVLLKFQGSTISETFEKGLSSQVYQRKKRKYAVGAVSSNMLYYDEIKRNKDKYHNFIAVPTGYGNKVRLVSVDLIDLSPKIEHKKDIVNDAAAEENFGNKKFKRAQKQKEKAMVHSSTLHEKLEETIAGIEVPEIDTSLSSEEHIYKPRINEAATQVEDIYSFSDLGLDSVLPSLSKEVENIANKTKISTTDYISDQLLTWRNSDGKEVVAQLWLYADCLIKFFTVSAKVITTKAYSACPYSEVVNKDILNRFTLPGSGKAGRLRPNIMKDKCICYLLIICLTASGYSMNIEDLAKELKTSIKRLQFLSRLLRVHVSGKTITLKLPLPAQVRESTKSKKYK